LRGTHIEAVTAGGVFVKNRALRHLFDAGRSSRRMIFLKIHWKSDDNTIRPVLFMGMGMWTWSGLTAARRLIPP